MIKPLINHPASYWDPTRRRVFCQPRNPFAGSGCVCVWGTGEGVEPLEKHGEPHAGWWGLLPGKRFGKAPAGLPSLVEGLFRAQTQPSRAPFLTIWILITTIKTADGVINQQHLNLQFFRRVNLTWICASSLPTVDGLKLMRLKYRWNHIPEVISKNNFLPNSKGALSCFLHDYSCEEKKIKDFFQLNP